MFLLQKGFNRVQVLGRTEEELDLDILKYQYGITEEGEITPDQHFENLEAENPRTFVHPLLDRMKKDELNDWLLEMNVKQMRRMVERSQLKQKAERKMIKLNLYKDEHIDVTQKRLVGKKPRLSTVELKEKYKYK